MIDLYLFRHAESEINEIPGLVGGRSNWAKLSKKGEEQAVQLGNRLKKEKIYFNYVYASPAERTKNTAKIACTVLNFENKKIIIDDRIQELGQGDWEGKPRTECYTPERMKILNSLGWNFKAPNGESRKEVEERMVDFLNKEILSKDSNKDKISIGIFSHGIAIKCLLRNILNFDQAMTYRVMLSNTSITHLRFTKEKGWFIEKINDGAHATTGDTDIAFQNWLYGTNS